MSAGQTANFSLDFASVGSFNGTVNLSGAITPAVIPPSTGGSSSSSLEEGLMECRTRSDGGGRPDLDGHSLRSAGGYLQRSLCGCSPLRSAGPLSSTRRLRLVFAAPAVLFVMLS